MNRSFAYSGSAPRFLETDLDYKALQTRLPEALSKNAVFQALRIFVFESWGRPPKSQSVVKSLYGIEKACRKAAPAFDQLFTAFNAANSEAWVELFDGLASPLQSWMEGFDRNDLRSLSLRLPMIADAAGRAARSVPTLPRGRPGKGEFSGLVLRLRKAFEAAGGKLWYTVEDIAKDDGAGQFSMDAFRGPFVTFVCEAIRQIKPFLQGAPVEGLLPYGVDVSTEGITEREQNAVGKAIKDMRAIKAARQRQQGELRTRRPSRKGKPVRATGRIYSRKNRK